MGNVREELSNSDISLLTKTVQTDLADFTNQMNTRWADDAFASNPTQTRVVVNIEGPVEYLALEALMAPHVDSEHTTMMDRDYVATVILILVSMICLIWIKPGQQRIFLKLLVGSWQATDCSRTTMNRL